MINEIDIIDEVQQNFIDSSYDRGDFITKIAEINVGKSKLVLTPMILKRMLSVFLEDMVESMKFACEMANRMTEMKEKKEQKMREVMMQVNDTINWYENYFL